MSIIKVGGQAVPEQRRGIFIRQQDVPDFCKVTIRSNFSEEGYGYSRHSESSGQLILKGAFYGLVRQLPEEEKPRNFLYDDIEALSDDDEPVPPIPFDSVPLTPTERLQAEELIQAYGDEGVEIEGTDMKFTWKLAVGKGWGQGIARPWDLLFITRDADKTRDYPLCTYDDCYSYSGTLAEEEFPKCLSHLGENVGFAVLEFVKREVSLKGVGYALVSFKYEDEDTKVRHLERTFAHQGRISRPPGTEAKENREFFVSQSEAEIRLSILQTASLFEMFFDTDFKCTTASVSFVVGQERQLLEELSKRGIQLKVISICREKSQNQRNPFPFGRKAMEDDTIKSLIDKTHAALYIRTDHQVLYGGQTVSDNPNSHAAKNIHDTVAQYEKIYGKTTCIPLSSVPRKDLLKMEAHLHVSLLIAYLLRLKNPFHPKFAKFHPYCLNKMTMTKHFDNESWGLIRQFMIFEFGVEIALVVTPTKYLPSL